jgi:hypothetical protein
MAVLLRGAKDAIRLASGSALPRTASKPRPTEPTLGLYNPGGIGGAAHGGFSRARRSPHPFDFHLEIKTKINGSYPPSDRSR